MQNGDKGIPDQVQKKEEVIFQLKKNKSHIQSYNLKIYDHYKLECRARRHNERNFQASVIKGKGENS